MPDEERRSFEDRVRSGEGVVSLINEPINEPVEPPLSARERARRRWRTEPELIVGGLNEQTDSCR
jgi:hypothetical protein